MALFRRSWRLSIQVENAVKTYQEISAGDISLKIDFDITSKTASYSEGSITICNLTKNDMYYLASSAQVGVNGIFKQNKCELECGYNGNLAIVLSGNIYEVSCDFLSADKKITLKVRGNIEKNFTGDIAISLKGNVGLKAICTELANKLGLQLDFDSAISDRNASGYSFLGRGANMLNELRAMHSDLYFFISEDGETFKVQPKENASKKSEIALSEDSGLIGIPTPNQFGLNATSLLNPALKVGGWIKLESTQITQYNGLWYIREVKHKGTNQGNDWLSVLSLSKNIMKA